MDSTVAVVTLGQSAASSANTMYNFSCWSLVFTLSSELSTPKWLAHTLHTSSKANLSRTTLIVPACLYFLVFFLFECLCVVTFLLVGCLQSCWVLFAWLCWSTVNTRQGHRTARSASLASSLLDRPIQASISQAIEELIKRKAGHLMLSTLLSTLMERSYFSNYYKWLCTTALELLTQNILQ